MSAENGHEEADKAPKVFTVPTKQTDMKSPVNVAIDTIGPGWFQAILTLYTGLYWVADAAETTTMSYLSSSVKCYWGASSGQASLISSIAFIGQIVGFYMCGSLGDLFGRKKVLIASAVWLLVFSIASATAPSLAWLTFFRMMVGMGMGSMPLTYTLLCECLPTHTRGIFLTIVHGFWGLGAMLCAGIAWAIMPKWGFRWLLALTAAPAAAILLCCWFVPESPYWLHIKGRVSEAEAVLRRIARVNGFKGVLEFSLPPPDDMEAAAHGVKAVATTVGGGGSKVPAMAPSKGSFANDGEGTGGAGAATGFPPEAVKGLGAAAGSPAPKGVAEGPTMPAAGPEVLLASPFELNRSQSSLRRRLSAQQATEAPTSKQPSQPSTAALQISVTWSQRGIAVRSMELQHSQSVQAQGCLQEFKYALKRWWVHTLFDWRTMFQLQHGRLRVSLLMVFIWFATQTASYGTTQTVINIQTEGKSGPLVCEDGRPLIADSKYRDVFLATAADIIAILFLLLFIEDWRSKWQKWPVLGRKWLFICTLTCWGTWMFTLTASLSHETQEAFIWLARGFNSASVVVMNVMTPEMYPTSIRGFAVGLIESASRLGGFITPYIVNHFHDQQDDTACLWIFGAAAFGAAMAALLVKDHTGMPLEDYDDWDDENIK